MNIFIDPVFEKYYQQHPVVLVDIGARGGLRDRWKLCQRYLNVIGFEPDERSFKELKQSSSMKFLNIGLYKEKGLFDLNLTRKKGCTSMLKPNRTFLDRFPNGEDYDILKTIKINVDALDSQSRRNGFGDIDFMKMDTQGTELAILEGATKSLENVFGLEIEVEFVPVYENVTLFADVDSFVRKFGFQILDLNQHYYTISQFGMTYGQNRGHLRAADALYVRTPESFIKIIERIDDDISKKSKVLRALSICILYEYYDYAVEIFKSVDYLFSDNEASLIENRIMNDAADIAKKIPEFRGRARIANLFYRLWKLFQPRPKKSIIKSRLGTW